MQINIVLSEQAVATYKSLFAAGQLDAGAYFTVIIMGAIAVIIYAKLMLADITIKMPESVPPVVPFLAIISTIAALYIISLIYLCYSEIIRSTIDLSDF